MSINDIRDQHKMVAEQTKMALFHAEAMKTNCNDVERCKGLIRELHRSLTDANKLLTMAQEYEAIRKN